ncbi:MAG: Hfq-related RNA-binding protein [Microcystaceae cyanobacterium]
MSEFDTGLPSTRLVQSYIKNQQILEVRLSTNEVLIGKLRWQDPQCFCLVDASEQAILIWRQAIVSLQMKN